MRHRPITTTPYTGEPDSPQTSSSPLPQRRLARARPAAYARWKKLRKRALLRLALFLCALTIALAAGFYAYRYLATLEHAHLQQIASINADSEARLQHARSKAQAEIDQLRTNSATELKRQHEQTSAEIAQIRSQADAQLKRQGNDTSAKIAEIKSHSAAELNALREWSTLELSSVASRYHDALLGWGDALASDFPQRRSRYQDAKQLAVSFSLDTTTADNRLALLETEIEQNKPASLPPRCTAKLLAATLDPPLPLLFLTVSVTDSAGNFVVGLTTKDFQLNSPNKPHQVLAARVRDHQEGSLSLALLIDSSNSTTGPLRTAAMEATKLIANTLPPYVALRLYTFGDTVTTRTVWTNNRNLVSTAAEQIKSSGRTSLLLALNTAAQELAARPAPRAILLFTDGRDTEGGITPDELLAALKEYAVTVYVVSLKTSGVDVAFLDQLAKETRGQHMIAERIDELPTTFSKIAHTVSRPEYALAALLEDFSPDSLSLFVGGPQGLTLPIVLSSQPATPLH